MPGDLLPALRKTVVEPEESTIGPHQKEMFPMIKILATTLLLSLASLPAQAESPVQLTMWQCSYIYEGDIADRHVVHAHSDQQAKQRVLEWAAGNNVHIDRFLDCNPI